MSKWIDTAKSDKKPPRGVLVLVCDFDAKSLSKSYYAAWHTDLGWRSDQIVTYRSKWEPRYWMPIPALPSEST
jgi:hypothetical protein